MKNFEIEPDPSAEISLADARPRRETPAEILEQFGKKVKDLREELRRTDPRDWHFLDTKAKRLRERVERTLKQRAFASHPDNFRQMDALIYQIRDFERTLEQLRPAA